MTQIEAAICELRREHPGWGPRRIEHQLAKAGLQPVPSRSSIYRCLRRHGLIELRCRRKRRDQYRRWERERPMQLWQMDVMGGVLLEDDIELKVVTGVDDHSPILRRRWPGHQGHLEGRVRRLGFLAAPPRDPR